jgi:hypothetical protein
VEGAAGTTYIPLLYLNAGPACRLAGFPTVASVASRGGAVLGSPAIPDATGPVATLVLASGAVARAVYGQSQALNYSRARCRPRQAAGLRVRAPGAPGARFLRWPHLACSAAGVRDSRVRALAAAPTRLVVLTWNRPVPAPPQHRYLLRCGPPAGTLPHTSAACGRLFASANPLPELPPCRTVDFVRAKVTGTLYGDPVQLVFVPCPAHDRAWAALARTLGLPAP